MGVRVQPGAIDLEIGKQRRGGHTKKCCNKKERGRRGYIRFFGGEEEIAQGRPLLLLLFSVWMEVKQSDPEQERCSFVRSWAVIVLVRRRGKEGGGESFSFPLSLRGKRLGNSLGGGEAQKRHNLDRSEKEEEEERKHFFLSRSLSPRRRRLSSSSSSCYLYALNALPENREKRGGTEQKKIRGMKRGGGGRRLLLLHCSVSYILCGNGAEGVRGGKKTIRE